MIGAEELAVISSYQTLAGGAALIKKDSSYCTKLKKVPRVFSPKP
jgi:hypothetical protein